jgi:hypothetical protein
MKIAIIPFSPAFCKFAPTPSKRLIPHRFIWNEYKHPPWRSELAMNAGTLIRIVWHKSYSQQQYYRWNRKRSASG